MSDQQVKGVALVAVYVVDFDEAYVFYSDVIGLAKMHDMGPQACFFGLPDGTGLYLEGGNVATEVSCKSQRAAFVLAVDSVSDLHRRLKEAGVKVLHDEPRDMGGGDYWFQFCDPSGNILEALGPQ